MIVSLHVAIVKGIQSFYRRYSGVSSCYFRPYCHLDKFISPGKISLTEWLQKTGGVSSPWWEARKEFCVTLPRWIGIRLRWRTFIWQQPSIAIMAIFLYIAVKTLTATACRLLRLPSFYALRICRETSRWRWAFHFIYFSNFISLIPRQDIKWFFNFFNVSIILLSIISTEG